MQFDSKEEKLEAIDRLSQALIENQKIVIRNLEAQIDSYKQILALKDEEIKLLLDKIQADEKTY